MSTIWYLRLVYCGSSSRNIDSGVDVHVCAEQHSKSCYNQPAKCFICNCTVELHDLKNHFRLECETEWLEYCKQETSSSLDFSSFWKQKNDGFRIKLKDWSTDFVLIIDVMFQFFKQNADENWSIGLIDLKAHSVIDVQFSTIQSNNDSSTTILTFHSISTFYKLYLLKHIPSIYLGINSIVLSICRMISQLVYSEYSPW